MAGIRLGLGGIIRDLVFSTVLPCRPGSRWPARHTHAARAPTVAATQNRWRPAEIARLTPKPPRSAGGTSDELAALYVQKLGPRFGSPQEP